MAHLGLPKVRTEGPRTARPVRPSQPRPGRSWAGRSFSLSYYGKRQQANAWRHGATPAPVVYFSLLDHTLRVCVADESDALPQDRTTAPTAESGRGLQLVSGLTHRWGVDPRKRGKTVWYELDRAA